MIGSIVLGVLLFLLFVLSLLVLRLDAHLRDWTESIFHLPRGVLQGIRELREEMAAHQDKLQRERPPPRAMIARPPSEGLVAVGEDEYALGEGLVGANETANVMVMPKRSQYCIPKAVSITVWADGWPGSEQRAKIEGVSINQHPQIEWCDGYQWSCNREALGVVTDTYWAPAGYGVPCGWGIFSVDALMHALQVRVRNENRFPIRVQVRIYGDFVDTLPSGSSPGLPRAVLEEAAEREKETHAEYLAWCERVGAPKIEAGDDVFIEPNGVRKVGTVSSVDYVTRMAHVHFGEYPDYLQVSSLSKIESKEVSNDGDDDQGS